MIPPYDEQAGTHIQYYTPCNDSAAVKVARADELLGARRSGVSVICKSGVGMLLEWFYRSCCQRI